MNHYLVFIISFLVAFISTPLFKKLAEKLAILDLPGRRKIHKISTPLLGGVAIYVAVVAGLCLNFKNLYLFWPILLGATAVLILGLIDDIKGLSAQLRLVCQLLIALTMVGFGIHVDFMPHTFFGHFGEILVTIIWILGVTNAFNYLDGLDGLASGSAVINLSYFTVILYTTRQYSLALLCLILSAACLGFIPHNFKRAKIFLGDAGSTFLGFTLACVALAGNWAEDNIVKISIPILILGVPIFDMIFTTIIRIKEVKVKTLLEWLQYGGKDHFHHYLVNLGLRPVGAVVFIYFITISLGLSAIMVSNDSALEALLTLIQASIIFGVIATLIMLGKRSAK